MCLCESAIPIPFISFAFSYSFSSSFSLKDKAFVWLQKGEKHTQTGPRKCFLPGFIVAEPSSINWPKSFEALRRALFEGQVEVHLSTSAFGSIMLGKEQNGGAALTALCDPGETESNDFCSGRASAWELCLNFFQNLRWLGLKSAQVPAHYRVDAL